VGRDDTAKEEVDMTELVNALGLACPEPVILTKKALTSHDDITVLVDNTTSLENVKRFGEASGCSVETAEEGGGVFRIHLTRQDHTHPVSDELPPCELPKTPASSGSGPTVFVIASSAMGHGSHDLGTLLMRAFIHTTVELEHRPDIMILYNTGVKLAASDSPVLDDLKALEQKEVKLLLCGTCVNFFELTGKIGAGSISNMYDIAGALSTAGRIVKP
jgi:selenium metabolism protein YedF